MASSIPSYTAGPPTPKADRSNQSGGNYTFPRNIGKYRTQIQMVNYDMTYATGKAPTMVPRGGVTLPMPSKINDKTTMNWQEESMLNLMANLSNQLPSGTGAVAGGLAGSIFGPEGTLAGSFLGGAAQTIASQAGSGGAIDAVSSIVGGATGRMINPFMWMLFKGPQFKEHQFDWILTANNRKESEQIRSIVNYLKSNMLPSAPAGTAYMDYPLIALVKFLPDDVFDMFRLKPCAVVSVNVNYSGAGIPSFFDDNAPTVVTLSVGLKEIEIWTYENWKTTNALV